MEWDGRTAFQSGDCGSYRAKPHEGTCISVVVSVIFPTSIQTGSGFSSLCLISLPLMRHEHESPPFADLLTDDLHSQWEPWMPLAVDS